MGRGGGSRSGGSSHSSHRSSGSSSGRSFGGSSSHSSRGGSSFSSSRSRGSSGVHVGGPSIHIGMGPGPHRRRYWNPYGGYVSTGYVTNPFARFIASIVAILFIFFVLIVLFGTSNAGVSSSTVQREKIRAQASFSKYCIDDDAGWIHNQSTLLKGMESFYKQTGVQPALAVYEEIDGERYLSDSRIEDFMYDEYDDLIGHEAGVLLLFCEYADSDYYVYYMAGEDAQTVMDSEACDILMDYAHALYTDNSLSDEEFFSAVFSKTADRIMTVTPTAASKIPVVVAGIVIICVAFAGVKALKQKHKRDAEKAAETERILNTPIDRI